MYTPPDSSLINDFGSPNGNPGNIWNAMLYPVDTLLDPSLSSNSNYWSSFNEYDGEWWPDNSPGFPGYLPNRAAIIGPGRLYDSMGSVLGIIATKNFYCYAHGTPGGLMDTSAATYIWSREVAALLGNHWYPKVRGPTGQGRLGVGKSVQVRLSGRL
jgi:hypothetical protein